MPNGLPGFTTDKRQQNIGNIRSGLEALAIIMQRFQQVRKQQFEQGALQSLLQGQPLPTREQVTPEPARAPSFLGRVGQTLTRPFRRGTYRGPTTGVEQLGLTQQLRQAGQQAAGPKDWTKESDAALLKYINTVSKKPAGATAFLTETPAAKTRRAELLASAVKVARERKLLPARPTEAELTGMPEEELMERFPDLYIEFLQTGRGQAQPGLQGFSPGGIFAPLQQTIPRGR